jgi:predicted nucleotide-binding protein
MTIAEELFQVADATAEALAYARADDLQKPLGAIQKACDEAKRAWSGSNLGYHADVYWEGLQPKPPAVQFSPEWGLKMRDRWLINHPDAGEWRIMDRDEVINAIILRAGSPDIDSIDSTLASVREKFSSLKEQAVSLLSAAQIEKNDPFIERKLNQIDKLAVATPGTIANSLVSSGQNWSRDSTAVTQGLRVAAHQSLIGLHLSATVAENGLETIEKASREAASHLQRLEKTKHRSQIVGTNVFIGHGRSLVWRDLKDFIKDRLHLPYDEFNRVTVAGITNITRLSEMLDAAAVAFVILTAEDEQADGALRARMNVIHEVGLFQGRLGFTKAIVLLEDGCEEFSNIAGLGQIRFPKANIASKFEEIRLVLEREGLLEE